MTTTRANRSRTAVAVVIEEPISTGLDVAPIPEPEPEPPTDPVVFRERFAESGRGLARDRWTQACLRQVRAAGRRPTRFSMIADPPLGTPANEGMRTWTLIIEVD